MSLVFAGVCSHAPGITGRKERADPHCAMRSMRSFDRMRRALEAQRPDALIVIARRALRQLLHEQHAGDLRSAWPTATKARSRIEAWLGIEARTRARHARAVAAPDRRGDADGGPGLRAGMEVRSRHHGAAALPDAALRPADHPGQHQLPGPAAHSVARAPANSARALRRACDAVPRAHRADRHRRHLALAGDAGLGKDQRAMGPRVPGRAGRATTARRCSPTATRKPGARPGRADSRSARSSPWPEQPKAAPASCGFTRPSRFSRWAAPLP